MENSKTNSQFTHLTKTKKMQTVEEVLQRSTYNRETMQLTLPGQIERELYLKVKSTLDKIGGKWNQRYGAILFPDDVNDYLEQLKAGQKVDPRKTYQFFETPPEIAAMMVDLAQIKKGELILEPSAGKGALIQAINKVSAQTVTYCELDELNERFLDGQIKAGKLNAKRLTDDFFKCYNWGMYDKIIANPPFRLNQDIQHIRHMYKVLRPGGRIVTVASRHWEFSENKTEAGFRKWLKQDLSAYTIKLDRGAFRTSGTLVETNLIIIDK